MDNKIKVLNVTKHFETQSSKVKLYDVNYKDKNGKNKIWTISSRNTLEQVKKEIFDKEKGIDGVAMCMIHKPSNKLVLLHEFRTAANDYFYTIPGGMLEHDENIIDCASRELKEETNLDLLNVTEVTPALYSAIGITNEKVVIVFGTCTGEPSSINQKANEFADICLIDIEQAKVIKDKGQVAARTYLLLREFITLGDIGSITNGSMSQLQK